jgi:hypothetical protein
MQVVKNTKIISGTHLNITFYAKAKKSNWQKITSDLIRSCHCACPIYAYTQKHIKN